jgi:hypothetical protein
MEVSSVRLRHSWFRQPRARIDFPHGILIIYFHLLL